MQQLVDARVKPRGMTGRPLTICAIGHGRSTHVMARTRCFADRGHRVYLITDAPNPSGIPGVEQLAPRLGKTGAGNLFVRALARAGAQAGIPLRHLFDALALAALLRRCSPDVVHVHFAYSHFAWIAGVIGCRPLAVTVIGGDVLFEEQGRPTDTGKWLTRNVLQQASYITAKSNHLLSVLHRFGPFPARQERVVWGISLPHFHRRDASKLRAALDLGESAPVVLSPRILRPFYRIELVIEAMALVARQVPDAVLLVTEYAADAGYKERLQALVRRLGLEASVRFCGAVSHDEMPFYYSLATVTVAVPPSDGLPQTLFEGMACEVPNIVTRLERYQEIVAHGESAYFVNPDPSSIAEGVMRLLSSADLRKRITERALAIVHEQADLEREAARVEQAFVELAGQPRRVWSAAHAWRVWRDFRQHARERRQ